MNDPNRIRQSSAAESLRPADVLALLFGEGFGLGRIPFAPGTFGSLWGIVIGWGMMSLQPHWIVVLLVWLIMFLAGIPICTRSAALRGKKDPGSVVWDEITAFPLVYLFCQLNMVTLLGGFVLFRLFDILKPWPIRRAEKLPEGLGIMADDQVAGLMAGLILALAQSLRG